jgi:hypothetical protein
MGSLEKITTKDMGLHSHARVDQITEVYLVNDQLNQRTKNIASWYFSCGRRELYMKSALSLQKDKLSLI